MKGWLIVWALIGICLWANHHIIKAYRKDEEAARTGKNGWNEMDEA